MVRADFGEGRLEGEATWRVVVLVLKGKGDYRSINLVEVMWKVVAVIIGCWITSSITYHNFLHGFQVGLGTGTATLEEKMLQ